MSPGCCDVGSAEAPALAPGHTAAPRSPEGLTDLLPTMHLAAYQLLSLTFSHLLLPTSL